MTIVRNKVHAASTTVLVALVGVFWLPFADSAPVLTAGVVLAVGVVAVRVARARIEVSGEGWREASAFRTRRIDGETIACWALVPTGWLGWKCLALKHVDGSWTTLEAVYLWRAQVCERTRLVLLSTAWPECPHE